MNKLRLLFKVCLTHFKQTTNSFWAGEFLAYFFSNFVWPLQRECPLTKTGYLYK